MINIINNLPLDRWNEYKELRLEALKTEPQAFAMTFEEEIKKTDEEWKKRLTPKDNANIRLFAELDNKLIGMIGCYRPEENPYTVEIITVYVSEDHRGHGYGKLLLQEILTEIKKLEDIKTVRLTVVETQKAALHTYRSCGFNIVNTLKDAVKFNGATYDEIVMEKDN